MQFEVITRLVWPLFCLRVGSCGAGVSDKMRRFSYSVFACETALQCAVTIKYFDPDSMFNQQRFLNVWALAAVQFDICE